MAPVRGAKSRLGACLALVLLVAACAHSGTDSGDANHAHRSDVRIQCEATDADSRFRFRSGFWLNLHNFLFYQAKRAAGIQDETEAALPYLDADTLAVRQLTPPEVTTWTNAVNLYVARVLPHDGVVNPVLEVNLPLAFAGNETSLAGVSLDPQIRSALEGVAPLYRDIWWPRHRALNAGWIAEMGSYLDQFEQCLGPLVARGLGAEWTESSIPVDASVYAGWYGAYTTLEPAHITMSTTAPGNRGAMGLEGLLHEAGHATMTPLFEALDRTAEATARPLPRELGHMLLFFTVGDVVWRALPGHPTYARAFGLWEQNARARAFQRLLVAEWRPYLRGQRGFEEALEAVVRGAPTANSGTQRDP